VHSSVHTGSGTTNAILQKLQSIQSLKSLSSVITVGPGGRPVLRLQSPAPNSAGQTVRHAAPSAVAQVIISSFYIINDVVLY